MISYQICREGVWFHCENRAVYYHHTGPRRIISLTLGFYRELLDSGELFIEG